MSAPVITTLDPDERPNPDDTRGKCPECGDDLVSSWSYRMGQGYLIRFVCWSSRGEDPKCSYYRVL